MRKIPSTSTRGMLGCIAISGAAQLLSHKGISAWEKGLTCCWECGLQAGACCAESCSVSSGNSSSSQIGACSTDSSDGPRSERIAVDIESQAAALGDI